MSIQTVNFDDFHSKLDMIYIERIEEPSYELTLHTHDCYQLLLCKHGAITHHLGDSSARMLRGDLAIIPPDTEHFLTVTEPKTIYYNIAFREALLSALPHTHMIRSLLERIREPRNILPRLCPKYEDIYLSESAIGKIRITYDTLRSDEEEIITNCLITVLDLIAQMYRTINRDHLGSPNAKMKCIHHCISYIDTHYDEPIPLDKIVKMSTMSRAVFCSLFKETTGTSFIDYLNKKRIERTQACIRNGAPITLAALSSGFPEFSTFHRNFIKYVGMTPSEYKKQCDTGR